MQPQPPQKPSFLQEATAWYRGASRPARIVVAILLLAAAIFVCSAAVSGVARGVQQSLATPTVAPTDTPTVAALALPTDTPAPVPTTQATPTVALSSGPALLGSDIGAFDAVYGPRDSHTDVSIGQYHYRKYADSNIDYLLVNTDTVDQGIYLNRADYITVQADENGWTMTQASDQCRLFFPQDAVHKQDIPVASGPALDKVYYSASLAKLFPAASFYDASQNPVKPGTFDVSYLYADASETEVVSCDIIIGEQQTK